MPSNKAGKFYAVSVGRKVGIYNSWSECEAQTKRFPKAKFKSFKTEQEARDFITNAGGGASAASAAKEETSALHERLTLLEAEVKNVRSEMGGAPARASAPARATTTTTTTTTTTSRNGGNNNHNSRKHTRQDVVAAQPNENAAHAHSNLLQQLLGNAKRQRRDMHPNARRRLEIHIMFDGGSRGNPGLGGAGAFVKVRTTEYVPNTPSTSASETFRRTLHVRYYLGEHGVTNNQAEYQGLLYGLAAAKREAQREAERLPTGTVMPTDLVVQGDSNLIIEQLKGSYSVKSPKLIPLYRQAKQHLEFFANLGPLNLSLEHVYRNHNKVADGLANEAMDSRRSWLTVSDDDHTEQYDISVLDHPTSESRHV